MVENGQNKPIRLSDFQAAPAQDSGQHLPSDPLPAAGLDPIPKKNATGMDIMLNGSGEKVHISAVILQTPHGKRWGDALKSTQVHLRTLVDHQKQRFETSEAEEEPYHLGME